MEDNTPFSNPKLIYNLFNNESHSLTNKNNLTEVSSEKVDSTTQNDEKNILENLSLKENIHITNKKNFPKYKHIEKKKNNIFSQRSKRIKSFRNFFSNINNYSVTNKKNNSYLRKKILFENPIFDNHRNCKSNCEQKNKYRNKTISKTFSDNTNPKILKYTRNKAFSERKNLYPIGSLIRTNDLSLSIQTQKNKHNQNFSLNTIEIMSLNPFKTINCNSKTKNFLSAIECKNKIKIKITENDKKNLYKDDKNYNIFNEEKISNNLNCTEDILNLNNKIKVPDEKNLLLEDNKVLITENNLTENKFNINLVEIPEEDVNLNENEDQIRIKKNNLSQKSLVFIDPENINNKTNELNKKNISSKENNKIPKQLTKSATNIELHLVKRYGSNKIINSFKNNNQTKINNNQDNQYSNESMKKFEKTVKECIYIIKEKQKYEKLITKLKSNIENLRKKKSEYETNFQKFKGNELKKLEKLRNENNKKIDKKSNKGVTEIQKLMEMKKKIEKEIKFRDDNNKIYINLLEKKLEDSRTVNRDLEIKLQIYKNMNKNYSQDKDNIIFNIELGHTPKKFTKKRPRKSTNEKNINCSFNTLHNRNKDISKLITPAKKFIYSSIESESKSRSLSKNNQRTMIRNNRYSTSSSNIAIKKRKINNLKSCTNIHKSRKISDLNDEDIKLEDLICLDNSLYNKFKKEFSENKNMYQTKPKNISNTNLESVKINHFNVNTLKVKSKLKPKKLEKLNLDFSKQKKLSNCINSKYNSHSNLLNILNDNFNENKKEKKVKIENKEAKEQKNIDSINNQIKIKETINKNKINNNNNNQPSINNINKNNKKNNTAKNFKTNKLPNKNISKPIKKEITNNTITNNLSKNKNININNNNIITEFIDNNENYDMQFLPKYHSSALNNLKIIHKSKIEDDKIIIEYENHKKTILFSKIGLKKEIFPDGYQINYFKNKDIKQIYPDGKEVYFYSQNNSVATKLPNGTKILKFENGQIEKIMPDGNKSIKYSDGIMKNVYKDGYEEILYCDGSLEKKYKSGVIVVKYKDGIEDTKLLDGNMLRKYCDGRIVKMDKNGEIYE